MKFGEVVEAEEEGGRACFYFIALGKYSHNLCAALSRIFRSKGESAVMESPSPKKRKRKTPSAKENT